MVLGLLCLLKTTIQVPVCIQAMPLSLDHKKESVINFHLHIFVAMVVTNLQDIDEIVY